MKGIEEFEWRLDFYCQLETSSAYYQNELYCQIINELKKLKII
jgi:hypothetical protein